MSSKYEPFCMIKRPRKRRLSTSDARDDERFRKSITLIAEAEAEAEAETEEETWSVLPPELLELIMSRLDLEDNIRASAVCKTWLEAAVTVRVVDQCPWLMHFPKDGEMYEFCDPSSFNSYVFELPELTGCVVCYSKDGWLLMHNPSSKTLFFFNPFTRELKELPNMPNMLYAIAFSSAPTSNDCWLFSVAHIDLQYVEISTFRFGESTEWTIQIFECQMAFLCRAFNKIVFSNGQFYCLSRTDWLGIFDPYVRTWQVLVLRPPSIKGENLFGGLWKKYMAEYKGEIFAIFTSDHYKSPVPFQLDLDGWRWVRREELDNLTIFASSLSSEARADLPSRFRSSVCLANTRFFGKRCVSCSVGEDGKFRECKKCEEQWPIRYIWIDPPKNIRHLERSNCFNMDQMGRLLRFTQTS